MSENTEEKTPNPAPRVTRADKIHSVFTGVCLLGVAIILCYGIFFW